MAKEQTGISGEFWLFSQLQRLGYEAYITLGNTKGIDISVKLNNNTILTFEVKSKQNFIGSFLNLNITKTKNHYAVFIDLKSSKSVAGKTTFHGEPVCYIVNSVDLDDIAFNWTSSTNTKGYGFEAKLLWYLKFQDNKSITEKNITDFCNRHKLTSGINFLLYDKIILTLAEFEDQNYKWK
jgi:hypothetical protein